MQVGVPIEIATPRLVLRAWRVADAEAMKAAIDANLEHLQAWMPWAMAEPSPLDVLEARLAHFEQQFLSGNEWFFSIRSRSTGDVLGGIGLHRRSDPDRLEIGYWLQTDATGRGYATEAAFAVATVAFAQPGIERVQIRCDPRNVHSAGVPRRLGFRHAITIPHETLTPAGAPRDTMVWELTRLEFAQRAPNEEL